MNIMRCQYCDSKHLVRREEKVDKNLCLACRRWSQSIYLSQSMPVYDSLTDDVISPEFDYYDLALGLYPATGRRIPPVFYD